MNKKTKKKIIEWKGAANVRIAGTTKKIKILVRVKDERKIFGRKEYLVTPIEGEGTIWIQNVQPA